MNPTWLSAPALPLDPWRFWRNLIEFSQLSSQMNGATGCSWICHVCQIVFYVEYVAANGVPSCRYWMCIFTHTHIFIYIYICIYLYLYINIYIYIWNENNELIWYDMTWYVYIARKGNPCSGYLTLAYCKSCIEILNSWPFHFIHGRREHRRVLEGGCRPREDYTYMHILCVYIYI